MVDAQTCGRKEFRECFRILPERRESDEKREWEYRYLVMAGLGGLLCLGYAVSSLGVRMLGIGCTAVLSAMVAEMVFALVRRKPASGGAAVHGLLLALMLPADMPFWMVALGAAFGTVFGKEVFGGAQHSLFNPVLVGKAFLLYSYPVVCSGSGFSHLTKLDSNAWQGAAVLLLLCAAMQLFARPSNAWIFAGIALSSYVVAVYVVPQKALPFDGNLQLLFNANGFLMIACLLSVDPAGAPEGQLAKAVFGMIAGGLAVLMRCYSMYQEAFLSALLIANIFAPTLDALLCRRSGKGEAA